MKIILSKQDLEDLVNRVYQVKNAGWDADDEHIIIDEVLEKLDPNDDLGVNDFGFDNSFKPYLNDIWNLNRGISRRRAVPSTNVFSSITQHIPKIKKAKK